MMDVRPPACIFLPGIIAPSTARYAALAKELGTYARAYTKELELYTFCRRDTSMSLV